MDQARSESERSTPVDLPERKKMSKGTGSPARRWARLPKLWLAGGVVTTLAAGLVVATASPALADPATTYVAVGSDTTQDVMDGLATIIAGGNVGSWDAVNPGTPGAPHDEINPKANCHMTRPNGSTEGLNALRKSVNPSTAAPQLADPPEPGCVDFSRSSSAPGGNANTAGLLIYIPFGLDAVAPATGGTTNIANADAFSLTQLQGLYQCTAQTVNGVTYDPNQPPAAGNQGVHLYIPQAGSGTRNFWAAQMVISPTSLPACVHDTFGSGTIVEEHDGTVLQGDPDGIAPFSIAQWVSQNNGHNDRRHGAVLHSLATAAAPTTPIPPLVNNALNTAYPITREVYNVTTLSRVTQGSADFDQALFNILVGGTSIVCSQSLTIRSFGFGLLASAPLGHTCGAVATELRAFATV
jgi:phosphate transport system substrate-binding protein